MSRAPARTKADESPRRHDLDWLRVIAFAVLIFYHVGMLYVTWEFPVKSRYASQGPEALMKLVNPWRLALLFFISGVALRFATDKSTSLSRFASSRLVRIGAPLVFGMLVVVMPQAYFEFRQDGVIEPGILRFYPDYLNLEHRVPSPTPTWNHLWYLVYLLLYTLLCLPLLAPLRRASSSRMIGWLFGGPARLLGLALVPFAVYELWLAPRFPTTHALIDDWATHAQRSTMLLLGYLAAKHSGFWRSVDRAWPAALLLAAVLAPVRLDTRAATAFAREALPGGIALVAIPYALTLYAWSCIVVLLAVAQRHLNAPSRALRYLTNAVFCYYVVHQTITVAAGYFLTQREMGALWEFVCVSLLTAGGCAVSFELLRRIPFVRVLFGIHERAAPGGSMRVRDPRALISR